MDVYDIIHGNINIDPLAKKIIDTNEFQRLRNIKQLGCCNFVFPSAVHTRFEHSIGVYHLANKFIDILNKKLTDEGRGPCFSNEEKRCITIAGLIHDIGHGPYSHLFDELFDEDKNHEYRSGELFKRMNKNYELGFNETQLQNIINYIYPKNILIDSKDKYKYQIISNKNGIDVDRFDYIMRDIKMTGLNYGIEYERIMNHACIKDNEIVFSEKVKTSIEEFYRIRYIMYKEVYNHRTVRGIEYMMKDFIKLYSQKYKVDKIIQRDDWDSYIKLNDNMIDFNEIADPLFGLVVDENIELKKIINNIITRNIYKSIGEIITDSPIDFEDYNKENIIIDTIKISYYGREKCKYFKERRINNTIDGWKDKDSYITGVYYKTEDYKQEAMRIYNLLLNI
tara:strand:- start:4636 stop:5820 length:1185 start_codon:yes stop_codon:yes gene_type:complete